MTKGRKFTTSFKKQVALAALRSDKTIQELAAHHRLHPNQISQWKRQAVDALFMSYPFYGSRQLMWLMGLWAIYQKPRTSMPNPAHKTYLYLLRGMKITQANHVWCTDITYIPMQNGFLYRVVVMDWATRHVLSWKLSNTLEVSFCIEALQEALQGFYVRPAFKFRWMGAAGIWIVSSSNACGAA